MTADLGARIERLALGPEHIEKQRFVKVARPLLAAFGYRPKTETAALEKLAASEPSPESLQAAWAELEENVELVERATIVAGRPLVAYAAWLRRVWELLARASQEGKAPAAGSVGLLPPLGFATEVPETTRALELELALVDHLLDGARTETRLLGRRRQQLLAARQVLLDVAAALPLDARAVTARSEYVAQQIAWLDRLQAAGLQPDVDVVHQARQASRTGDVRLLYAALRALEEGSDAELGPAASRALGGLRGCHPLEIHESLERSAKESFGAMAFYDDATRACALAVDGAFELGAPMTPVRIEEERRRVRAVRFPTPAMQLVPARGPEDLRDALISDPRALLLDLAAGRLLSRRFIREEVERHSRVLMTSEVRVYVLDGSTSMRGNRSRMRDAIVLAELATLRKRLEDPGHVRPMLYFRYFTEELGDLIRASNPTDVDQAIASICATEREGGTDIEKALLSSFATIAQAKANDPALALAQIVLVTDGRAPVDEAKVTQVRESLGELPIGVSVIALGEENAVLRALVARQRTRGERAFYHFMDDAQLEGICSGAQLGPSLHADVANDFTPPEQEIGLLLDELELIARRRDQGALDDLELEADARREAGLEPGDITEGERARTEALYRDRRALEQRFARWFPEPPAAPRTVADDDEEEAVYVALAAIAEVLDVVGGTELHRRADAIALIERLLPEARLTPAVYARAVSSGSARIATALRAVHHAVAGRAA
ncbi:VWA domain-containing protein [Pendulispora brunnea]|uniref:VWA domain-containing protein n=1 Tax=Pendulispora brunnea TaxID=2905690 RepID=A0ABZ2K1B4_9BACT